MTSHQSSLSVVIWRKKYVRRSNLSLSAWSRPGPSLQKAWNNPETFVYYRYDILPQLTIVWDIYLYDTCYNNKAVLVLFLLQLLLHLYFLGYCLPAPSRPRSTIQMQICSGSAFLPVDVGTPAHQLIISDFQFCWFAFVFVQIQIQMQIYSSPKFLPTSYQPRKGLRIVQRQKSNLIWVGGGTVHTHRPHPPEGGSLPHKYNFFN